MLFRSGDVIFYESVGRTDFERSNHDDLIRNIREKIFTLPEDTQIVTGHGIIPEEIAVQRRHDGPSSEVDRRTIVALLNDSWETSTLGRRKVLQGLLGMSAVLVGLVVAAPLGGMIKNPWKAGKLGIQGDGTLWTSGWTLTEKGVKLYLGRDTGALAVKHETDSGEHYSTQGITRLVRMRPEDLAAAAMETVFPLPEEDVNDGDLYDPTRDVYETHMHSIHGARNAVMLIRLRSSDAAKRLNVWGRKISTSAITTPIRRFVHISVAPPRCMRRKPTGSCAPATSRSSTHCITASRCSAPPPALCHSCRLPLMKTVTSSPRVTLWNPLAPHSGSVSHNEHQISRNRQ